MSSSVKRVSIAGRTRHAALRVVAPLSAGTGSAEAGAGRNAASARHETTGLNHRTMTFSLHSGFGNGVGRTRAETSGPGDYVPGTEPTTCFVMSCFFSV